VPHAQAHYGTPYGPSYGPALSSRSRSPRSRRSGGYSGYEHPEESCKKFTCRFIIGIENEDEFRVARRLIGSGGARMKDIVAKTGGDAKLRLRGSGSGFLERDTQVESPEPLQLCISCTRHHGYHIAVQGVEGLLVSVYDEYTEWCAKNDRPRPHLRIQMTERHFTQEPRDDDDPSRRRGGRNRKGQQKAIKAAPQQQPNTTTDRGVAPPNAPPVEDIEAAIDARNAARRENNFAEADRIRDDLKDKGVVLSDEKGGHGSAAAVTSWRYWND